MGAHILLVPGYYNLLWPSDAKRHHRSGSTLDSLKPGDAYMRQYNIATLVQIMACRLLGGKPLTEPILPYSQLHHKERISVICNLKFVFFFIQGNALENIIYEMAAILPRPQCVHYSDVIMSAMASQITGVLVVCSTICSSADQRKQQSSASLAFVRGIHWWLVKSPHNGPVTRKMLPFDDVIM